MLNKKATVLMPVYNGAKYVEQAIESVLAQTYTDFDLLIINDGSTDNSEELIRQYQDERIIYEPNEQNMGLIKTLNKGLDMIEGEYVIRMDADDICHPERFEKQIAFMDQNQHIAVAGSSVKRFNETGTLPQRYVFTEPIDVRTFLLFGSPLRHPAVILRNRVLQENGYRYDESLDTVEDYGLWQTISEKHLIGNLPDILLEYRINEEGITQQADKKIAFRDAQHTIIYRRVFDQLEVVADEKEVTAYRELLTGRIPDWKVLAELLERVFPAATKENYNMKLVENHVKTFMTTICLGHRISLKNLHKTHEQYFKKIFSWGTRDDLKFIAKKFQRNLRK